MFLYVLLFICFVSTSAITVASNDSDSTALLLWSLSNLAVENKLNQSETEARQNNVNGETRQFGGQFNQYRPPNSNYPNPGFPGLANPSYQGINPAAQGAYPSYQGANPTYFQGGNPAFQGTNLGFNRPNYPYQNPAFNRPGQYAPNFQQGNYYNPGLRPTGIIPGIGQSVAQAIDLISKNDDLQCVPRLLCELITGPDALSQYRQSNLFSGLNFDMSSLLGVVSTLNGFSPSPILTFAKAAILGYANRKRPEMCVKTYSKCPTNPDQLVNYLNNYNGGFFRYFGGVPGFPQQNYEGGYPQQVHPGGYPQQIQPGGYPQQIHPGGYPQQIYPQQNYAGAYPQGYQQQNYQGNSQQNPTYPGYKQQYPQNYQQVQQNNGNYQKRPVNSAYYTSTYRPEYSTQNYYRPGYPSAGYRPGYAQKRIITKPDETQNSAYFIPDYERPQVSKSVAFPVDNSINDNYGNYKFEEDKYSRTGKSWKFPDDLTTLLNLKTKYALQNNHHESNRHGKNIPFNRVKVKPVQVIYPDRTGTGELVLDI